MIKRDCPWCNTTFKSSSYPRSAGLQQVREEELEHISEEHQEKQEKFEKMKEIWDRKVFEEKSTLETIVEMIKERQIPSLPRNVVTEYTVEEFEEMSREELIAVSE